MIEQKETCPSEPVLLPDNGLDNVTYPQRVWCDHFVDTSSVDKVQNGRFIFWEIDSVDRLLGRRKRNGDCSYHQCHLHLELAARRKKNPQTNVLEWFNEQNVSVEAETYTMLFY